MGPRATRLGLSSVVKGFEYLRTSYYGEDESKGRGSEDQDGNYSHRDTDAPDSHRSAYLGCYCNGPATEEPVEW